MNETKKLEFSPIKFCYLRDTLNDLSNLEGFQSKFAYIPMNEYVTQLDKLIVYFEEKGYLKKIVEFPCKSCDAIYDSKKEAIACDEHTWKMHDFMAKSVEEGKPSKSGKKEGKMIEK